MLQSICLQPTTIIGPLMLIWNLIFFFKALLDSFIRLIADSKVLSLFNVQVASLGGSGKDLLFSCLFILIVILLFCGVVFGVLS